MASHLVLEDLCLTCSEPLVVVGHKSYCPTCQPKTSFVVGYEGATRYSFTRVDPRTAHTIRLAPKRRATSKIPRIPLPKV